MRAVRFALRAAAVVIAACNKHNVPLGGECERGEDCDKTGITCLKADGAAKGYCSTTCSIPPPGTTITPGGKTCEDAGMACIRAAAKHPILGEAYCIKKP